MTGNLKQRIGLILGPLLAAALLLFADLKPGQPEVTRTAAVAMLMAVWWITEAIPIPATALLPVILFPLLGVMKGKAVAGIYFNNIIFLFIGGFIVALAMEKWGLHRRIALRIILLIGASPRRILLGFMAATFFLSMWISNTATAMMMMPMALAIIIKVKERFPGEATHRFALALLLGIAYAASVGGMATLIGTPPNLAFARIYTIMFPDGPEISFAQWFAFATPLAVIMGLAVWGVLTLLFVRSKNLFGADTSVFREEFERLGKRTYQETAVLVLFVVLALAWLTRSNIEIGSLTLPGWSGLFPEPGFIDDGTVAIAIASVLFLLPARTGTNERLMDWETAKRLHWGIVLLFGGGFALAAGFEQSGLSVWMGDRMASVQHFPPILIVATVCVTLTFLTELTSNTATTQIVLPILGSLAAAIHTHPLLLMIPATLSASCAFMLPVATPPNAIVFGSGEIEMSDMIRTGIILNLIGVVVITIYMFTVGDAVFAIDPSHLPAWAVPR